MIGWYRNDKIFSENIETAAKKYYKKFSLFALKRRQIWTISN